MSALADLAGVLDGKGMDHLRGRPHRLWRRDEIRRRPRTMKNWAPGEYHVPPGERERQNAARVDHSGKHRRQSGPAYPTSLRVRHDLGARILKTRQETTGQTIAQGREPHRAAELRPDREPNRSSGTKQPGTSAGC